MSLTQEYLDILNEYRAVLESNGINVQEMYAFGSRVKGTNSKWSDLDVGIVSADFSDDLHGERVRLMHLRRDISDLIEPHPFLVEDFNNKYNPLVTEIKKNGVKVV